MTESKFAWFSELALRVLAVVSIGFVLLNCWSIYRSYADIADNPLLPNSLASYKAFPHYFFIAFYIGILFFIWRCLKSKTPQKVWYIPIVIVVLFESFKMYIYGFLMWVNVFG